MTELNRMSITARCPDHLDKVIYESVQQAVVYGVLHRIRYGGKQQKPYPCPTRQHFHLKTNYGQTERRRRRVQRLSVEAWENEGGAWA